MTDYLARLLEVGSLQEELKKAERVSTAGERSVENRQEAAPPLLERVQKTEAVFHRQHRFGGLLQPHGAGVFHTLPHIGDEGREGPGAFIPLPPSARQTGFPEAESVDLAFRRDSRRYDNGFFLY